MNRMVVGFVCLVLCFAFAPLSPARQTASDDALAGVLSAKLARELDRTARNYPGVMGIYIQDLKSGQVFAVHADTVFPQASSIKIPLLIALLRQAQAGKLNLSERVEIHRAALVGGSGVLQFFSDRGSAISLHDLAVLMVVLSDNSATNLLIDRVGMDNVNSMLDSLGLHRTRLVRKMMDVLAERAGRENRSTPREMATLVEKLATGKLLDAAYTRLAMGILTYPKDSPLRAGLPGNVAIAEKPGSLDGAQCDTGIVLLEHRPYAISVMTTFNEGDGNRAIAAVSKLAYEYFERVADANAYGVQVR